jgi:hypothetical protein
VFKFEFAHDSMQTTQRVLEQTESTRISVIESAAFAESLAAVDYVRYIPR